MAAPAPAVPTAEVPHDGPSKHSFFSSFFSEPVEYVDDDVYPPPSVFATPAAPASASDQLADESAAAHNDEGEFFNFYEHQDGDSDADEKTVAHAPGARSSARGPGRPDDERGTSEERLRAEAKSLNHQVTHEPYNPFLFRLRAFTFHP